jgi:Flp pilus assembly pilin Flp
MKRILIASFRVADTLARLRKDVEGSVFVEYLLLLTLVGIGVIAGLAAVRSALINELLDLANAINAISCP